MRKYKKIIYLLLIIFFSIYANKLYASYMFTVPVDDIITSKVVMYGVDKKGKLITNKFDGEVSFSYNFIDWSKYSYEIGQTFGSFQNLMLRIHSYISIDKDDHKIYINYYYHIPEEELLRIFSLVKGSNKDTYIKIKLPVVEKYQIKDNDEKLKYYVYYMKVYVNGNEFIMEWLNENQEGVKERLIFDKEVFLHIYQILLSREIKGY